MIMLISQMFFLIFSDYKIIMLIVKNFENIHESVFSKYIFMQGKCIFYVRKKLDSTVILTPKLPLLTLGGKGIISKRKRQVTEENQKIKKFDNSKY